MECFVSQKNSAQYYYFDMIIDIKVHGGLLLFYFVSVLSITNHEKQEQNREHNQRRSERLPTVHCDCVSSKMAEFSLARRVFTVFLCVIFTGLES